MAASRFGLLWGFIGVAAFSLTLPLTRIAVGGLSPLFIGCGRAVIAALLAAVVLGVTRQRRPRGSQWWRLALAGAGVIVGFPLLTSYALTTASASHGAVVIALLPAATAVFAVLRGHERPPLPFWVFAVLGAVAALAFASLQSDGLGAPQWTDLLFFGAVISAAFGYSEGALLSRELGSWQTISWALVILAPAMVVLTVIAWAVQPPDATPIEWASFAYLAVISMFLGFFAWYRGLAIGPVARVSQVQLVQPVLTLVWAALLLGEELTLPLLLGGLVVILCAALAVRVRLRPERGLARA
ncbi:DMT family transporter [Pseudolysinimonas yzui]|uniref:Membrane protein n=1 Tax=Pseudolysinimonas yzui TaxID=2708254 RepID=A0A8J3GMK4_9MICO|nr:DMT family transporter [Pseudolysinimonas yzui]GHF04227.1 membrane protein [Pseudolysinimonas yzui]